MPVDTMASAISRISDSLTSQPNLFHEFQPMGGVAARTSAPLMVSAGHRVTMIAVTVRRRGITLVTLMLEDHTLRRTLRDALRTTANSNTNTQTNTNTNTI